MAFWPFKKRAKPKAAPGPTGDRGILVFSHTSEVIRAEKSSRRRAGPSGSWARPRRFKAAATW
jgi:hypothetical protein